MSYIKNQELAKILHELADILELERVQWKPQAYRKAARTLETLDKPIEEIAKLGLKEIEKLPGVGEGIGKKILEYVKTGKIKELRKLKRKEPKGITEILKIPGMGPKKAKLLYEKLKIDSVKNLEKAIKTGKIKQIPSIKQKTIDNIQRGIRLVKLGTKRKLLGEVMPIAEEIINNLKKKNKFIEKIELAGSLKRMQETIGDIDILIISKSKKEKDNMTIMNDFVKNDYVREILAKGPTKTSVILYNGMQTDIRVINKDSFGAAMQYFTGNKDHNIKLRKIAIAKGYKLSEYGLYKNNKLIASKSENEIYKKLGLNYIEPEMRLNLNELELAKKKLPKLIGYNDIKGDLHTHTNETDGSATLDQMIKAAIANKYQYIAISDHSKSQRFINGLSEERLLKQIKQIKTIQRKYKKIKIFTSCEVDILKDGELDFDNNILKKLDIVLASVHSGFKQNKEKVTSRICNALENKHVNILGHPTGRLINQRDPYQVDMKKIFEKALDNKKILEINSQPLRLDLNDNFIREANKKGILMTIDSDAHSTTELDYVRYGIGQSRRAGITKKNIVNTKSLSDIKKILKLK